MDRNLSYIGNLFASEELRDLSFSGDKVMGVSDSSYYCWDLKMMKIKNAMKTHLGYTSIIAKSDSLALGSRLGNVYLHDVPQ